MIRFYLNGLGRAVLLAVLCLLLIPALALAAEGGNVFAPTSQLWVLILGSLTPLVTYVLNHYAPWVSEAVKAAVLVVVAAAVGALYTAIETSVFGWNNQTAQLVLTAIAGALFAHHLIWKPSTVATKLGAGSNAPAPGKAA